MGYNNNNKKRKRKYNKQWDQYRKRADCAKYLELFNEEFAKEETTHNAHTQTEK